MKIIIANKKDIKNLAKNNACREVHITRPLSLNSFILLTKKLKNLEKITLSKSTFQRLSKKAKNFLKEKNIVISIKSNRGKPLLVEPKKILEIIELRKDFFSIRKIASITSVPKSTVHYLLKKAKKTKIKAKNLRLSLK